MALLHGTASFFFASTHKRFSSEGIQIGNVCSAAGIVGTWTGAHHEEGQYFLDSKKSSSLMIVSFCYPLETPFTPLIGIEMILIFLT